MRLKKQKLSHVITTCCFAIFAIAMNGCDALYLNEHSSLESVQQKDAVVVLTTQSPLSYKTNKNSEASGIDHDLIENFANLYNLKIRYKIYANESDVMQALRNNEGDFAAARLRGPQKNNGFLMGPAYEETQLSLFCQSRLKIANIRDLNGRKVVMLQKDNAHGLSERLTRMAPMTELELLNNARTQKIMGAVESQKYDCAIAEDSSGQLALRYNGRVEHVTELTEKYSLNWIITPDNRDLWVLMQAWFQRASRHDEILRVVSRYKDPITELDRGDLKRFRTNIVATLPTYKKMFTDAAREHQLPWQLVAAVAYQESHWNPDARSFTGVRGLMQLTSDTAAHLGIEDRTDPLQSIRGGSKYLRYLIDKTPRSINSKDRLALALASYNIGFANLRDAQKMAVKMGLNPHSWHHMREVLPQLANARGYETVAFVERVKSFYSYMTAYN